MKLRVLFNTSAEWGTVDSDNFDKNQLMRYLNYLIKTDISNENDELGDDEAGCYGDIAQLDKMSIIPVVMSDIAWNYVIEEFNTKEPDAVISDQMLAIFQKYKNVVFKNSLSGNIDLNVFVFIFPPLVEWLDEDKLKTTLERFTDKLCAMLDEHDDENNITELSCSLIIEGYDEGPENGVYN